MLSMSDIQVFFDGQNQTMFGYLIQVELPEKETEWEFWGERRERAAALYRNPIRKAQPRNKSKS